MAQRLKCLPGMRETWVRSLGREDPWRRKWQPTPVFLPGRSHGQRSLAGYTVFEVAESDMTGATNTLFTLNGEMEAAFLSVNPASRDGN